MDKVQSSIPERRHSNYNLRIIFSSIALLVVFVIELYAMINYSDNYIVLGICTLLMILSFYVLISSIMQIRFIRQLRAEEQYDSIFKSEKASYLLLRKNFDEIAERMDLLEKNMKSPSEEIMNAQKALAKVIINRSKENAETLINTNLQMMEKIDTFDAILSANNDEFYEKQKQLLNQNNQQYILKQQELLTSLKEVEANIKSDLLQTMARTPVTVTIPQPEAMIQTASKPQPEIMVQPASKPQPKLESAVEEIEKVAEEPSIELQKTVEKAPIEIEKTIEETPIEIEEIVEEAPTEIEESIEEAPTEIEETIEEAPTEIEETIEETPIEGEGSIEETPVEIEEELVEEPQEKKPPIPDLSDPNKKMSAEEIAAMFANADAIVPAVEEPALDSAVEEPAIEATPVEKETPTEEKPPMPDLSDPNKMLSPEEIAALISNM